MSETSLQWRECGNKNYKAAGTVSTLTSAADYLKIAIDAYGKAVNLAKNDEERCFALRNFGMANWHLGKNYNKQAEAAAAMTIGGGNRYHYDVSHRAEYGPHSMIYFYKEALDAFARCLPVCGRLTIFVQSSKPVGGPGGDGTQRNNPEKFMEQLKKNLDECAKEALSFLSNMDYFSSYKARVEHLQRLMNACGTNSDDWAAVFQLEVAKTFHKWAVTEMERSSNYRTALHCLHECYSPFEKIGAIIRRMVPEEVLATGRSSYKKEGFGQFTSYHREQWEDLEETVKIDMHVAEARRFIQQGDDMRNKAIFDSEEPNIDLVHDAINAYRQAVVALHDGDTCEFSLEAEAFSKIAQVYFGILKNEVRARMYCTTSINLAGTVEHHNFVGKEWYDKAAAILKQIQDEIRKKDEEEVRKNREPFMKKLEKELAQIEEMGKLSAEKMIAECLKLFPPKHKKESKVIEELSNKKFNLDTERLEVKKCLCKLILLYHPDHVDIKEYGGEYFVLCEEITKAVTKKYEFFKG